MIGQPWVRVHMLDTGWWTGKCVNGTLLQTSAVDYSIRLAGQKGRQRAVNEPFVKVSRCSKVKWRSSQGLSRFCRFVKDKPSFALLLGFRSTVLLFQHEARTCISIALSGLWNADRLWRAHIPTSRQASIKNSSPYPPQASWVLHSRLPAQFPGNALTEHSRVRRPGPKTSALIKATSAASPRGSMYL